MSCSKYRSLIIPWVDGELDQKQAEILSEWFVTCASARQCSSCLQEIDFYRKLKHSLQALPHKQYPAWAHQSVMHRIIQEPIPEQVYHRRHRWEVVPIAAAILLSLWLGSLVSMKTFVPKNEVAMNTELIDFGENHLLAGYEDSGELQ